MVINWNFLCNIFSLFFKVDGVTLFPCIFVRDGVSKTLINHEKIHIRQQMELLIVGFFILYILSTLYGLIKYRNFVKAYRNNIFEKEAYANQYNMNYLNEREFWAEFRVLNK